jgi:hypothetical protein
VPVWYGSGTTTDSLNNVFEGAANLTQQAYGTSVWSTVLATNKVGQVLWRAFEDDGSATIWLSSPAAAASLSGVVSLTDLSAPSEHSAALSFPEPATGNELFSVPTTLAADGIYTVSSPRTGLFDVRVSSPHFLSRVARGVPLINNTSMFIELPNGDASLDNRVSVFARPRRPEIRSI